ncbi:MAG TPA: efflux RND transporter periplasmic adaptor subunit [Casimicrobiaceae bacterium]|nr:efflux RND transporter periplasmic adaptor subunit [Casimicrobiaceae bacterium]
MPQDKQTTAPTSSAPETAPQRAKRKRWLVIAAAVFVLAGAAYGAYWALVLRYSESTDDAYVSGNVVQITPQISGTVVAIDADDTQFVTAGQTLVQLDQADAKVALDEAEAQLARTVREVRGLYATSGQGEATVAMRRSELDRTTQDLARREHLAGSGAISKEELQHARDAVDSATSALQAAEQQLVANRARVDRTTIEDHPDVRNAAAHWRNAYLAFARTTLPAPVAGFVAKRAVQLGQRVGPGAPLMAIVPLDEVWVDANFKEAQLATMRLGQPVSLTADLYGGKVTYHGRIAGFGAGTGAAFAVLPAQNATGNWIKIVQRVPVRIALDRDELAAHPLQVGLSMQVDVDTHDRRGDRLPQVAASRPTLATEVFRRLDETADQRVKAIIAANEGASSPLAQSRVREGARDARLARANRANAAAAAASAHAGPL